MAGVQVQRMEVLPHPADAAQPCLVLLTQPLTLRDLRPALQAVEAWPDLLGYAHVLRAESLV
jgi:hypothetical protein